MLTADQIEPHGFEEGSEQDDEVVEEVEEQGYIVERPNAYCKGTTRFVKTLNNYCTVQKIKKNLFKRF